jgi:hypothetical protein
MEGEEQAEGRDVVTGVASLWCLSGGAFLETEFAGQ